MVCLDLACDLVVLRVEAGRVCGHGHLHSAQEERPAVVPARVPPRHHVPHLVDRRQVGGRRTVLVNNNYNNQSP